MASRMNSWSLVKTLSCFEWDEVSESEVANSSIWKVSSEVSEGFDSISEDSMKRLWIWLIVYSSIWSSCNFVLTSQNREA
jgi:hypothetical protein